MTTDLRGQSSEVGSDDLVSAVKERNDRWRGKGVRWGRCEGHRAGKWEFRSDVRVKIARAAQLPAHCVCLAINSPWVYFQSLGFSHFVWGEVLITYSTLWYIEHGTMSTQDLWAVGAYGILCIVTFWCVFYGFFHCNTLLFKGLVSVRFLKNIL